MNIKTLLLSASRKFHLRLHPALRTTALVLAIVDRHVGIKREVMSKPPTGITGATGTGWKRETVRR